MMLGFDGVFKRRVEVLEAMITIEGLTKKFGPIVAVDDLSLSIERGEVLGFLGPNGAGKSTTMRMVTGYLPPTDGRITVCGYDIEREPIAAKKRIGYLPEGAPLYGDMTPAAFLNFIAGARQLKGDDRARKLNAAIERVQIGDVLYRPIDTLSKGFKRRVGLAQAILHDPDVLILDEPTDGLDPNQKHQVRNLIREMARDKVIVISTHILEEVEAVCSRAVIIANGKLTYDGTPGDLQRRSERHNAVSVHVSADAAEAVRTELDGLDYVARIDMQTGPNGLSSLIVMPKNGVSILHDLSVHIRDKGIEVEEMYVERGHLNDVFRQMTTGA